MPVTPTLSLKDAATHPSILVGGKAKALGLLIEYGAPVPPGFVVPPAAELAASDTEILAAFDHLNIRYAAVRSSAVGEDAADQSWAGQFESYLYVPRAQLLNRIADCRASGASARARSYDAAHHAMPVAVVVQAMIPADTAGVLFTANPVTRNRDEIMIEAVYGLGEQLVQGLATPDNYLLDRAGHTLRETIATKTTMLVGAASAVAEHPVELARQTQPALTPAQRTELAHLATDLEAKFGHPLDIEWAYAHNQLYIVQARPITTL
jgi:phosphoenolpyruvate synthase/pyruvate phosphate dikinase